MTQRINLSVLISCQIEVDEGEFMIEILPGDKTWIYKNDPEIEMQSE